MSIQVFQNKPDFAFPKSQKLCSEKLIQDLFKKGQSVFSYPFKIYYSGALATEFIVPQVLFSVPKKNFKKSVDRNHIKRKLKEIYRCNKSHIFTKEESGFVITQLAVVYVAKENISFHPLHEKLISILYRLRNSRKK